MQNNSDVNPDSVIRPIFLNTSDNSITSTSFSYCTALLNRSDRTHRDAVICRIILVVSMVYVDGGSLSGYAAIVSFGIGNITNGFCKVTSYNALLFRNKLQRARKYSGVFSENR